MLKTLIGPSLAKIAGCRIAWDRQTLNFYSVDSGAYFARPAAVAYPSDEKDIARILRFATRYRISVTPRGAGTGLVGGAIGSGIILDMKNFDRMRVGRGFVEAGSGVFKGRIDKELRRHGKFLGPNPSIGPFCTLGGMIGTNASGSHSLKYGSTIDNLISVRIVTARGIPVTLPGNSKVARQVLQIARSKGQRHFPYVSKNSCGYRIDRAQSQAEVQKIIAGSEGTLGIITSAKMRTLPMPRQTTLMVISYKTLKDAAYDVPKILKVGPSAIEMIDKNIAQRIKSRLPRGTRCLLFVEFDDNVLRKRKECGNVLSGRTVAVATRPKEISRWWAYRNSALSHTLRGISKDEMIFSSMEDAAVPVRRLPLLLELVEYLSAKYPIRVITYGHAGNGNLHTRPILRRKDMHLTKKIAREFFSGVISMGGTITGEHGDGIARSKFVKVQYGKETYGIFKSVKKFFDPHGILNPGKIVV